MIKAGRPVAQTSKSVYPEGVRGWSRVSKSAHFDGVRPADLEVGGQSRFGNLRYEDFS